MPTAAAYFPMMLARTDPNSVCVWRQVGKEVGMRGAVRGGGVWGVSSPKEIEEFLRDFESTESMQE